jgi:hypothetical protein
MFVIVNEAIQTSNECGRETKSKKQAAKTD